MALLESTLAINNRYERLSEDLCFEERVLGIYGSFCKDFWYTKLIDVTSPNWDRTSRQTTIRTLVEAQPLYFQPESFQGRKTVLIVNSDGRGVGRLEARTADKILRGLHDGLEWHAHVRQVHYAEDTQTWNLVIMLLSMATPEQYERIIQKRKTQKDCSLEWAAVAVFLLGIAISIL